VLSAGSVSYGDAPDGRPVKGVSTHNDVVLNSSTNSVFSDRRVDTFWDRGKINLRAHLGIIDFQ
jgi:hypothetical protein